MSSVWLLQLGALLHKDLLLASRRKFNTGARLLVGAIVIVLLCLMQGLSNVLLSAPDPHPSSAPINAAFNGQVIYGPVTPLTSKFAAILESRGLDIIPVPGGAVYPFSEDSLVFVNASDFENTNVCGTPCSNDEVFDLECLPCGILQENSTIVRYAQTHPEVTNAIFFFGSYYSNSSLDMELFYNITVLQFPFFEDSHVVTLHAMIEEALLQAITPPGVTANMELFEKSMVNPPPRVSAFDVFSSQGAGFLFIVPSTLFFFLLTELVQEKENLFRVAMRQMGLLTSAWWFSWFIQAIFYSFVSAFVLEISGYISNFDFFHKSSFRATFLLFLLIGFSMSSVAFLMSTVLSSGKTAQTVGYTFLVGAFVFQALLSSAYPGLLAIFYANIGSWTTFLRGILLLYPPYLFVFIFYFINSKASSTMNIATQSITPGVGFHYSDLFKTSSLTLFGYVCNLPAPIYFYGCLAGISVANFIFAFYLDAVIPGPHGTPKHPLFFLGFQAKGASLSSEDRGLPDPSTSPEGVYEEARRVQRYASMASENFASSEMLPPILIQNLRVVYRSGWTAMFFMLTGRDWNTLGWRSLLPSRRLFVNSARSDQGSYGRFYTSRDLSDEALEVTAPPLSDGSRSTRTPEREENQPTGSGGGGGGDVLALKDLSLHVRSGEILALLGHNGAGKSTTISVTTGLITPSGGSVRIAGVDVVRDRDAALQNVGCCPQHDILWGELTARETLNLFARIKGIGYTRIVNSSPTSSATSTAAIGPLSREERNLMISSEVDRVLKELSLDASHVQHAPVLSYSGGMKRRLSVAVAALGQPKVLLLDEISTGVSIDHRNEIWRVVRRLRRSAAIVLTTHSMEEADRLGDRIAIMAAGRLESIGDPLRLKSRFGDGYRLSLVLRDGSNSVFSTLQKAFSEIAPCAQLQQRDAASVVFMVPFNFSRDAMPALLDWCDENSAGSHQDSPRFESEFDKSGNSTKGPGYLLKEYTVGGPSLESVFMRITSGANFNLAQDNVEGFSSGSSVSLKARSSTSASEDSLSDTSGGYSPLDGSTSEREGKSSALHLDIASMQPSAPHLTGRVPLLSNHQMEGGYIPLVTNRLSTGMNSVRSAAARLGLLPPEDEGIPSDTRQVHWSASFRAMFIKNLTLLLRNRCMCICQLLTPVVVILILWVLQRAVASQVGSSLSTFVPEIMVPVNYNLYLDNFMNMFAVGAEERETRLHQLAGLAGSAFSGKAMHVAFALSQLYAHPALRSRSNVDVLSIKSQVSTLLDSLTGPLPSSNPSYDFSSAGGLSINPNCLEFFLYAVQPLDGDMASRVSSTVANIGSFGNVHMPAGRMPNASAASFNHASGLLGNIMSSWCSLKNGTFVPAPYFDSRIPSYSVGHETVGLQNDLFAASSELDSRVKSGSFPTTPGAYSSVQYDLDLEFMEDLMFLVRSNTSTLRQDVQAPCWPHINENPYDPVLEQQYCPSYITPDGAIVFHDVTRPQDASGTNVYTLKYTMQVNDLTTVYYHRPNGLTRMNIGGIPTSQQLISDPGKVSLMDLVFRAYVKWAGLDRTTQDSTGNDFATPGLSLPSVLTIASFPTVILTNILAIIQVVGSVLWPVALSMQLPLFLSLAVHEKEERLVELQLSMGLSKKSYNLVTFLLNFLVFLLVIVIFWVSAVAFDVTMFTKTSPTLVALSLIGWGLCVCSFSTLLAPFLWSRQTAIVIGFTGGLFVPLLGATVAAGIYGSSLPWSPGRPMPSNLYAVPFMGPCMAFVRILYQATFSCSTKGICYSSWDEWVGPGSECRTALVALFLSAPAYQLLGLYLEEVLPKRHGIALPWHFIIPQFFKDFLHRWTRSNDNSISTVVASTNIFRYLGRWSQWLGTSSSSAERLYAKGEDIAVGEQRAFVDGFVSSAERDYHHYLRKQQSANMPGSDESERDVENIQPLSFRTDSTGIFDQPGESTKVNNHDSYLSRRLAEYPVVIQHLRKEYDARGPLAVSWLSLQWRRLRLMLATRFPHVFRLGVDSKGYQPVLDTENGLSQGLLSPGGGLSGGDTDDPNSLSDRSSSSSLNTSFSPHTQSTSFSLNSDAASDIQQQQQLQLQRLRASGAFGTPGEIISAAPYLEPEQTLLERMGTKVAVSDLSLVVTSGSCVGLLGENGCGKSTTINALIGLAPATAGRAFIGGHDCSSEVDLVRLSLGVAPQHDTLWPSLTVEEHVLFYARVKGVPERLLQSHVRESLEGVGLLHVRNRLSSALSGGMRRRLSIAIALAGTNRVILLDEPTTGLDPASKRKVWRILERARTNTEITPLSARAEALAQPDVSSEGDGGKNKGRAIILVSHDMAEVESLATSIVIMTFGRIRCAGTGVEIKSRFGAGHRLLVRYFRSATVAINTVFSMLPGTRVESRFSGYITFLVPTIQMARDGNCPQGYSIAQIFRVMGDLVLCSESVEDSLNMDEVDDLPLATESLESLRVADKALPEIGSGDCSVSLTKKDLIAGSHGISEWSVSPESLDAVFQRIVRHYRDTRETHDIDEEDEGV